MRLSGAVPEFTLLSMPVRAQEIEARLPSDTVSPGFTGHNLCGIYC